MALSQAQHVVGSFAEMVLEMREPAVVWPAMMKRLEEAIGFDAGYIASTWGTAAEGHGAVVEHDATYLKQNLARFLGEMQPAEVARYTDRARLHQDVWSRERQRELSVFREVLEPTGMKHMIVRASVSHGNLAGFNLERRTDTPYTERDLHLVDLVAPFLHISAALTHYSEDETIAAAFGDEYHLTERESAVVALVARGLQNAEVALLTGVSANTVRNCLVRIFEKVGVTNRAELAYLATRPSGHLPNKPPRRRGPMGALSVFKSRVEEATEKQLSARPSASNFKEARQIVYTPPTLAAASPDRPLERSSIRSRGTFVL
jgi:DNA-binding CsgD family transcriptional regulator